MIDFLTACWFGVIGACVGSFLNVVAYRMPLGMSVIWKPSHCPKCKTQILARDNVPVLGWLWLKGKCRACSEPISPRYAIVEAVMGLTFFVLCYAEVFSGGANLPTGPLTEGRGALENVIEPNWTVLGVYGFHCLSMCVLMVFLLIDLDQPVSSRDFILEGRPPTPLFLFLIGILTIRVWWEPLGSHYTSENSCFLEFVVGGFLALVFLLRYSKNLRFPEFYKLVCVALAVVILFFGPQAMKSMIPLTILIAVFVYILRPVSRYLGGHIALSVCFVATLLHTIYWKQLHLLISS